MKPGVIRIIAGKWRGKHIPVTSEKEVRPTPDRIRETLFNWLSPHIIGSRCLDVFAGTGALGFEALSRGAAFVEFVDHSPQCVAAIQKQLASLDNENTHCYQASVPNGLHAPKKPFNIIFLDPPYKSQLLLPTCDYLETHGFLAEDALIYLEADHEITDNQLLKNWKIIKSKKAGQVHYHLATRNT